MSRMLVVYYSWSNGNTKRIAEQLARRTGADIARIETVQPYTGSYDEVVDQGQREVNEGYRPPIQPLGVNVADYDINLRKFLAGHADDIPITGQKAGDKSVCEINRDITWSDMKQYAPTEANFVFAYQLFFQLEQVGLTAKESKCDHIRIQSAFTVLE